MKRSTNFARHYNAPQMICFISFRITRIKFRKCQVKCKGIGMDRKLMRNGNCRALCLNATILDLLKVNPKADMFEYTIERGKLIITKSDKNGTIL